MRPHLTVEQRQLALRLKARGLSRREIGPQAGCSHQGVALVVQQASRRPVRYDGQAPGPGRLTLADREEITISLHAGESFTAIAHERNPPADRLVQPQQHGERAATRDRRPGSRGCLAAGRQR
jgi:hypothetical protein